MTVFMRQPWRMAQYPWVAASRLDWASKASRPAAAHRLASLRCGRRVHNHMSGRIGLRGG
jgi:hypothetical protein